MLQIMKNSPIHFFQGECKSLVKSDNQDGDKSLFFIQGATAGTIKEHTAVFRYTELNKSMLVSMLPHCTWKIGEHFQTLRLGKKWVNVIC